ncbi:hypothetical protein CRG98_028861, partial [Punica granatum]
VRNAKIKFLGTLQQGTDEECTEWNKLKAHLKSEYPKHTPLLAKILEGLLSRSNVQDKVRHQKEVIEAADEVIDSIDTEELAKFFAFKSDPEDEEAEKMKNKMETTRDQLVEALYQKGQALAEIESANRDVESASEGSKDKDGNNDQSAWEVIDSDLFEENFKELKKWVDVKSAKYGNLLVIRERRSGRLGTALKALNDMIQEDADPPKKQLYELKLSLLEEMGWGHLVTYERTWMHVRFPPSLPLF